MNVNIPVGLSFYVQLSETLLTGLGIWVIPAHKCWSEGIDIYQELFCMIKLTVAEAYCWSIGDLYAIGPAGRQGSYQSEVSLPFPI